MISRLWAELSLERRQKMLERFHVKLLEGRRAFYSHSMVLGGLELMS